MLKIKAESVGGAIDLIDVATEVINFAKRVGAAVEFDFNGKELLAHPWHKPEDVVGQYYVAGNQPTTERGRWVVWEEPRDGLSEGGIPITVSVQVRCTEDEAAQIQKWALWARSKAGAWTASEAELVAAFMEATGATYEVDG